MSLPSITSRDNDIIRRISKLSVSASYRRETGEYVCEGDKLLSEALSSGARLSTVLFSEDCSALSKVPACAALGAKMYVVPQKLIGSVSSLKTPQDVVFSCHIPSFAPTGNLPSGQGFIILDRLSDPGNMGTIIRTADAFGIGGLFLSDGCVDPYNPKVVRSAMGSLFRAPLWQCPVSDAVSLLRAQGFRIYTTLLSENSAHLGKTDLSGNIAVAIGNEGTGVSPELSALSDGSLYIPMTGGAESLNAAVAAGLVMWEMKKGSL